MISTTRTVRNFVCQGKSSWHTDRGTETWAVSCRLPFLLTVRLLTFKGQRLISAQLECFSAVTARQQRLRGSGRFAGPQLGLQKRTQALNTRTAKLLPKNAIQQKVRRRVHDGHGLRKGAEPLAGRRAVAKLRLVVHLHLDDDELDGSEDLADAENGGEGEDHGCELALAFHLDVAALVAWHVASSFDEARDD